MYVGAIVDLSEYEVNAVASLLKLYLRELPEPLIPLVVIPQFEAIASKELSTCICAYMYVSYNIYFQTKMPQFKWTC